MIDNQKENKRKEYMEKSKETGKQNGKTRTTVE